MCGRCLSEGRRLHGDEKLEETEFALGYCTPIAKFAAQTQVIRRKRRPLENKSTQNADARPKLDVPSIVGSSSSVVTSSTAPEPTFPAKAVNFGITILAEVNESFHRDIIGHWVREIVCRSINISSSGQRGVFRGIEVVFPHSIGAYAMDIDPKMTYHRPTQLVVLPHVLSWQFWSTALKLIFANPRLASGSANQIQFPREMDMCYVTLGARPRLFGGPLSCLAGKIFSQRWLQEVQFWIWENTIQSATEKM